MMTQTLQTLQHQKNRIMNKTQRKRNETLNNKQTNTA